MRREAVPYQVKERGELRENKHLLPRIHATCHQVVDRVQFGGGTVRVLIHQLRRTTDFTQQGELGKDADPVRVEIRILHTVERSPETLLMSGIQFALLPLQSDRDNGLELVRQIGEHITFQSALDE